MSVFIIAEAGVNHNGSLELAKWLEGQAYDQIELCGVVTNICVLSNAVLCKAAEGVR